MESLLVSCRTEIPPRSATLDVLIGQRILTALTGPLREQRVGPMRQLLKKSISDWVKDSDFPKKTGHVADCLGQSPPIGASECCDIETGRQRIPLHQIALAAALNIEPAALLRGIW
jgi:hypothetical protein